MKKHVLSASVLPLLFLPLACDTPTSPPPRVTLLVTNATCATGTCSPLEVRAFPENQPRTPGGPWSLEVGVVDGGSACLLLPAADTFRVTNGDTGETTTFEWTSERALSLGVLEPGSSAFQAVPSTDMFVPASADGWSVTLPDGAVAPAEACEPAP